MENQWDELMLFAQLKERPGLYLGGKSLLSLRDHLFGMQHAFQLCFHADPMEYLRGFSAWYRETVIREENGYACWWNHILYTSANCDGAAFDAFFSAFERYLAEERGISLPAAQWDGEKL